MFFLLRNWKLLAGITLLTLLVVGYNIWASHQRGVGAAGERVKWEAAIAEQKIDSAAVLAGETEKVINKDKALQEAKNKQEANDAKNRKIVSSITAELSRLRDSRRGQGGGFAAGNVASGSGDCPDNGSQASGILSAKTFDALRRLALEADEVNLAYISCRTDSETIRR